MRQSLFLVLLVTSAIAIGCQSTTEQPTSATTPAIASSASVSTQILSPNAYKAPYLGYDGIFYLNTESKLSINDPRNPKRIDIQKMETFTFYKEAAGKTAIARDCHYAYLGATPDSKYYPEYKTSVWDLFELEKIEKQDPACNQFKYVTLRAPHDQPVHLHFRYGDDKSSFQALVSMSTAPEDNAKFNPWWPVYCGVGKTACGKDE